MTAESEDQERRADERKRAIEAFRVLNDMLGDLLAATRTPEMFAHLPTPDEKAMRVVNRMCFSYLILTLAKFVEFYDYYKYVIPKECIDACKAFHRALGQRRVPDFRNKGIGHIWDDDTGKPLTSDQVDDL